VQKQVISFKGSILRCRKKACGLLTLVVGGLLSVVKTEQLTTNNEQLT
jgi:hypothetical protein